MLAADCRSCYLLLPRCVSDLRNVNNRIKVQALAHPTICGSPIQDRVLVLSYILIADTSIAGLMGRVGFRLFWGYDLN